jgi:hypothetical protein
MADINAGDGSVWLEFRYESYKLTPNEAQSIGERLTEAADEAEDTDES